MPSSSDKTRATCVQQRSSIQFMTYLAACLQISLPSSQVGISSCTCIESSALAPRCNVSFQFVTILSFECLTDSTALRSSKKETSLFLNKRQPLQSFKIAYMPCCFNIVSVCGLETQKLEPTVFHDLTRNC